MKKTDKIVLAILLSVWVATICVLVCVETYEDKQEQKVVELYLSKQEDVAHISAERIDFAETSPTQSRIVAYRLTIVRILETAPVGHRTSTETKIVVLFYDGLTLIDYEVLDE